MHKNPSELEPNRIRAPISKSRSVDVLCELAAYPAAVVRLSCPSLLGYTHRLTAFGKGAMTLRSAPTLHPEEAMADPENTLALHTATTMRCLTPLWRDVSPARGSSQGMSWSSSFKRRQYKSAGMVFGPASLHAYAV